MAEKALVTSHSLVESLLRFRKAIQGAKGPTRFCMLHQDSTTPEGQWNLLFGAKWVEEVGRKQALEYIATRLYEELDEELRSRIARVVLLDDNEPFVKLVRSAFSVSLGGKVELVNCTIGSLRIERAILFVTSAEESEGTPS